MDIGAFHPQIVHFVIGLLFVGVGLRCLSLIPKLKFISGTATLLILLGTVAAVLAEKSGDDAHSVPERIPGARAAIENHEAWGTRTRNLFLIIAAVELAILATSRTQKRPQIARGLTFASAILGCLGAFFLYEAGQHGGEVVYEYGGGVGTRSGDPEDIGNLLTAGLYHAAMLDREAGRKADAARLIDEMARRATDDLDVRLLLIESHIVDRGDAQTALNLLNAMTLSDSQEERLRSRAGLLRVQAFETLGQTDSAQATLTRLKNTFPENQLVQGRQLTVPTTSMPVTPAPATTTGTDTVPRTTTRD